MKQKSFGPHLTLDLKGCPKEVLENYELQNIKRIRSDECIWFQDFAVG